MLDSTVDRTNLRLDVAVVVAARLPHHRHDLRALHRQPVLRHLGEDLDRLEAGTRTGLGTGLLVQRPGLDLKLGKWVTNLQLQCEMNKKLSREGGLEGWNQRWVRS